MKKSEKRIIYITIGCIIVAVVVLAIAYELALLFGYTALTGLVNGLFHGA
jgi:hypothetical protein